MEEAALKQIKTGRTRLGGCWNATERVDWLFEDARKKGMDAPSDSMIEDAIRDAEFNALWNPIEVAKQHDQHLPDLRMVWKDASNPL